MNKNGCIKIVDDLAIETGINPACNNLGIAKSSYYYWKSPGKNNVKKTKRVPDFAYTPEEREYILSVMNSDKYMDKSPYEIKASKLDEGEYLCSERTMYRLLEDNNQVRERRNIKQSNNYKKPELLATQPNEVWTWDITKLKGPAKWTYFYLYVIIDIFSRYIVGWMVAYKETAVLAKTLIEETVRKQNIRPNQLTIHADRGSSMRSKPVAFLLSDLGITKSHSRPYVSNDNPFSESHFKTMKYSPWFPDRFEHIEESRDFCRKFFDWYNKEHYHSGIGFLTPETVHCGLAVNILKKREKVLLEAFNKNPKRFRYRKPKIKSINKAVWINKPKSNDQNEIKKNN